MGKSDSNQPLAEEPPPRLADSQFYRALAAKRRRRVLYYLLETNRSSVEELATVLCGWEATSGETMQTTGDRRECLIVLSHNHLPKLAEAGLVEYNPTTGSVRVDSLHPQIEDIIAQSVRAVQTDES